MKPKKEPPPVMPEAPKPVIPCSVPGCAEPAFCSVHKRNTCRTHYPQVATQREPGDDA